MSLRLQLQFLGCLGMIQEKWPQLVKEHFTNHSVKKKRDYTDFVVPTATRQPESYGALREKDTRTGGI